MRTWKDFIAPRLPKDGIPLGKNPKFARPDDKVLLGLTSRLNNENHLLFLDFDNCEMIGQDFYILMKYLSHNFGLGDISFLAYKTNKGYHAISLNQYPEEMIYRMMISVMNQVDRWHIGYSIAKGFATLRTSKKSKADEFHLMYFHEGKAPISKPHFYFFKHLFNVLEEAEEHITSWFDEGIHFVGYIMDKDKI
jgi:hypothetical protein